MNASMDASTRSQPAGPGRVSQLISDPCVWILAVAPLYILFVSSNWIFSSPDSIDPWVYHGFFRNLQEYKTTLFPGTYYGSRLSWILPGYLVYKFLPPLAANYALHLGLWYAAVFALYYTLKSAAGRHTALITAIFLGSYIHFLRPLGSDYVDGPADVCFLICFALLTAAARNGRRGLRLALAGAAFAAAVFTNLFTIIFAPVVALYFALLLCRARDSLTVRSALTFPIWFLSGAATLTALLGVANFVVEGNFPFYMPSVYYVLAHAGQPNPWKLPIAQWIGQAEWLIVPGVAAVSALIAFANRRFRGSLAGPASGAACLLALLLMIFCEWLGIPVLQYPYYASYLIPTAFLAIGALLAGPLERISHSGALTLAIATLLLATIPLWGHNQYLSQLRSGTWPILPLLLGAVFAACALMTAKTASWVMTAALAACLVTSASTDSAFAGRHARRDSFARIADAAAAVDAVRGDQFIWFWYGKSDPYFSEFHALHSIYLWGYTMLGAEFPVIHPEAPIIDGALVVVPSSDGDPLSPAREALAPRVFTAEPVERREIRGGGASYSLWFLRTKLDAARLEPLELQACGSGPCSVLTARAGPSPLPPEGWTRSGTPQTTLNQTPGGMRLRTALAREGYAAKYGPLTAETGGRYLFKLQYVLVKGGLAFGAKSSNESRWIEKATIPVSQPGERTAVLSLELPPHEPFWLMIANDHPLGDHASEYQILELEAYRFPAAQVTSP
jgi:hypothetical protein